METNSGLTTKDAQYAICKGTYANKKWSSTERQTACKKYEQLTGTKIEPEDNSESNLLVTGVSVLIVISLATLIVLAALKWKHSLNRASGSAKTKHKQ